MHLSVLAALCAGPLSTSAQAWDLEEDNALYVELAEDADAPTDAFLWMEVDLLLADAWLADGDPDVALSIAYGLDRAMRVRIDELLQARGPDGTDEVHKQIRALVRRAGGRELRALEFERG